MCPVQDISFFSFLEFYKPTVQGIRCFSESCKAYPKFEKQLWWTDFWWPWGNSPQNPVASLWFSAFEKRLVQPTKGNPQVSEVQPQVWNMFYKGPQSHQEWASVWLQTNFSLSHFVHSFIFASWDHLHPCVSGTFLVGNKNYKMYIIFLVLWNTIRDIISINARSSCLPYYSSFRSLLERNCSF